MAYPYTSPNPLNYFIGKGVVSVVEGITTIDGWASTKAFATNSHVMLADGTIYKATTGGVTSSTEPTAVGTDGSVTWAAVTLRDVGNVPEFKFLPEIRMEEHYSSRRGIQVLDLTVDIQRKAKFSMTMDEFTLENMGMVMFGDITGTSGSRLLSIMSEARTYTAINFVGTNDVGQHFHVVFPAVRFAPPKEVGFISEKFGELAVEADAYALASTGSFGVIEEIS